LNNISIPSTSSLKVATIANTTGGTSSIEYVTFMNGISIVGSQTDSYSGSYNYSSGYNLQTVGST